MLKRCVLAGAFLLTSALPLFAQTPMPVSVGAGLQTSFVHTDPAAGTTTDQFLVNSVRLYVNGTAAEHVKYMLNTEYNAANNIQVLDAVAQFSYSPQVNIWAGRFIAPSDRANLYGPYYSHHWAVYQDGVQDGYPFLSGGRDNGVMWWGQFNKVKVSAGGFDGLSTTGNKNILGAARIQVDLWDAEDGYYLNGTYYGAKNLLAFGLAAEAQNGVGAAPSNTAWNADLLLEKKLPSAGVFSLESQFNKYNGLGGYDGRYASSDGGYGLASYLFPQMVGTGKIEVLGKYAFARFQQGIPSAIVNPNYNQKTAEIDLNYVFKEFNGRLMFFFKNTDFNKTIAGRTDTKQVGVGLQIQM